MEIADPDPGRPRRLFVPPGGPPRVAPPSRAIYEQMGEANIGRLTAAVYAEFSRSAIAHLFPREPHELAVAAAKSAAFFVGLLGGPPVYQQRYGSPMLRARHLPFAIDETARQEWLRCFDRVLDRAVADFDFPAAHLPGFRHFLHEFSRWMVNTAEADHG